MIQSVITPLLGALSTRNDPQGYAQAVATASASLSVIPQQLLAADAQAVSTVTAQINLVVVASNGAASSSVGATLRITRGADSGDSFWNKVLLLLKGEGTTGSTTFTDSSPAPQTQTSVVTTTVQPTQFKFGASSIATINTGKLVFPPNTGYTMGTGLDGGSDLTVDLWLFPTNLAQGGVLFNIEGSFVGTATAGMQLQLLSTGAISFFGETGVTYNVGTSGLTLTSAASLVTQSVWNHIAVERNSNGLYLYVNGVMVASALGTVNFNYRRDATIIIGSVTGFIDEFRVTRAGRYGGVGFNPPAVTAPLTGGVNNLSTTVADSYASSTVSASLESDGTNVKKLASSASAVASATADVKFPITLASAVFAGAKLYAFNLSYVVDRTTPILGSTFYHAESYALADAYPLPVLGVATLAAGATSQATVTAALAVPQSAAASAVASATATAALALNVNVASDSFAQATASAALQTGNANTFSSDAFAIATATGSLVQTVKLAASAAAVATSTANEVQGIPLSSAVSAVATSTSDTVINRQLASSAAALSTVSAALRLTFTAFANAASAGDMFTDPLYSFVTMYVRNAATGFTVSTVIDVSPSAVVFSGAGPGVGTGSAILVPGEGYPTIASGVQGSSDPRILFTVQSAQVIQTGDYAVEGWISNNSTFTPILTLPDFAITLLADGTLQYVSSGLTLATSAGNALPTTQQTHFAFVRSGTTITIFVNGVAVASGTDSVKASSGIGSTGVIGSSLGAGLIISGLKITKGVPRYTANFDPLLRIAPIRSAVPLASSAASVATVVAGLNGVALVNLAATPTAVATVAAPLSLKLSLASAPAAAATVSASLTAVAGAAQTLASAAAATSTATAALALNPKLAAAPAAVAASTSALTTTKPLASDAFAVATVSAPISRPIVFASAPASSATVSATLQTQATASLAAASTSQAIATASLTVVPFVFTSSAAAAASVSATLAIGKAMAAAAQTVATTNALLLSLTPAHEYTVFIYPDNRTLAIPAENRTLAITRESRSISIAADLRTVNLTI